MIFIYRYSNLINRVNRVYVSKFDGIYISGTSVLKTSEKNTSSNVKHSTTVRTYLELNNTQRTQLLKNGLSEPFERRVYEAD